MKRKKDFSNDRKDTPTSISKFKTKAIVQWGRLQEASRNRGPTPRVEDLRMWNVLSATKRDIMLISTPYLRKKTRKEFKNVIDENND